MTAVVARDTARSATSAAITGAPSLRVTHVIHCLEGGGMELIVAALVRGLRDRSVSMSIITLDGRVGSVGDTLRGDVETILPHRSMPTWSMLFPLALARDIRATHPDVVHLYSGAWYKGALAARLAGVRRIVYTEHGLQQNDHHLAQLLFRLAARMTTDLTAVSVPLRDHLVRVSGVAADRVHAIENGVDVDAFAPGEPPAHVRASLGIPENAAVVGSVGRLEAVKAYDVLIRAVASVPQAADGRPVHLVLCGSGSLGGSLAALARDLGIAARVHFAGWTDNPLAYYRLFDVFALSSRSEGAPMSLMEAMATGAAPVVADVGSIASILGPGLQQQLVVPGDATALARTIEQTLAPIDRCRAIGIQARSEIVTRHSFRRMIAEYESLYRR